MACVTLKRSLDFDPLHHGGGSCSPRPQKRRRCLPMCVSPQSAAASGSATAALYQPQSPFAHFPSSITAERIAQNVREEIHRLRRRRLLRSGDRAMDEYEGGYDSPGSPSSPLAPLSPASCGSGLGTSLVAHPSHSPSSKDKPLFTFRQVNLICEQMIRDREVKIREEYDKVLNTKLAEQYDCFVRFTADQIQQRLSQAALPSYLS